MYKKLSDEALSELLEIGIREFADKGFEKANITEIAKKSGLSVGVLYKYFDNKDDFFVVCVRHSLKLLDQVLSGIVNNDAKEDVVSDMEMILRFLIKHAKEHPHYYVMYHEITAGACRKFAPMLAEEIETVSAKVYTGLIKSAQAGGLVRSDVDPGMIAFFFDNLLMMLQFSFTCDYYGKRMEIYCKPGENGEAFEEKLVSEMMKFMNAALGLH